MNHVKIITVFSTLMLFLLSLPSLVVYGKIGDAGSDRASPIQLWELGSKAFSEGNFEKAGQMFQVLIDAAPEQPEFYHNLAVSQARAGKFEESFTTYRTAIRKFPDNANSYLNLCRDIGLILNSRGSSYKVDTDEAIDVCHKAVELSGKTEESIAAYSGVLSLLNRFDQAAHVMEMGLKNEDANQEYKMTLMGNLALTNLRSGKYEKAWELSQKLLDHSRDAKSLSTAASIRTIGWPIDKLGWEMQREALFKRVRQFQMGAPLCNNGKWKPVLNYSNIRNSSRKTPQVQLLNPGTAYKPYGSNSDVIFVGPELPIYPRQYHERFIQMIHFNTVYVAGHGGNLHLDCRVYTGGHYTSIDLQSFPTTSDDLPIVNIGVPVASIMQHQLQNFYHWICEAFPRLLFLRENILQGREDVHVLLPGRGTRHVDQTLDLEELSDLRIYRYPHAAQSSRERLFADKGLYFVDWIHPLEDEFSSLQGNAWAVYSPPREALQKVRSFFHGALQRRGLMRPLPDMDNFKPEDIYNAIMFVSRPMGKAVRSIPNENQIIQRLKKSFGSKVVKVHFGNETLLEQAAMAANARIILGAHGAGLTNLVFSRPGTSLLMFPMDPHVEFCFGHLATALDSKHWVFSDLPASFYYANYGSFSNKNIKLLLRTVRKVLREEHSIEREHILAAKDTNTATE